MSKAQFHQLELYLAHHQSHTNVLFFILPAIAVLLDSMVVITVGFNLKRVAKKAVKEAAEDVRKSMETQFPILTQLPEMLSPETLDSINDIAKHSRGLRSAIGKVLSVLGEKEEMPTGTIRILKKQ